MISLKNHPDNGPYLVIDLNSMFIDHVESNYYDAVIRAAVYARAHPGVTVVAVDADKNIVYRTIY